MLTPESIENFGNFQRRNGLSENTIRAYASDLRRFRGYIIDKYLPEGFDEKLSVSRLETYAGHYLNDVRKAGTPANTVNRWLASIRSWARWEKHPEFLCDYKAPTAAPGEPHPLPEGIDDVDAMIRCAGSYAHRALIALCGLCGLRVEEAVTVWPADIDIDRMELTVRGKGDKTRIVPISQRAWKAIQQAYSYAERDGHSLVKVKNRGARAAITRIGRRAGVGRHVKSHDLRATFGTAAYERSKDLRAVQELLGHASSVTTQVYTGISRETRRGVVESL